MTTCERSFTDPPSLMLENYVLEICQTVGIGRQLLVGGTKLITHKIPSETLQIDHIECRNVIWFVSQVLFPESTSPKLKS
jgi:hypothetical protein